MSNWRITDKISLVIAVVSIALGIVVGFLTPWIYGVLVSLLCATLGESIRADVQSRLRLDLETRIGDLKWLGSHVNDLLSCADRLRSRENSEFLLHELRAVVERSERQLDELNRGWIVRSSTRSDDLVKETDRCQRTLDGVTNISSRDLEAGNQWWNNSIGRTYWEANIRALERKVTIRRVFVVDELNPAIQAILDEQARAGVRVSVVESKRLAAGSQLNVAIWDGGRAWQARMNATGAIVANQLFLEQTDIHRVNDTFLECLQESEVYTPDRYSNGSVQETESSPPRTKA